MLKGYRKRATNIREYHADIRKEKYPTYRIVRTVIQLNRILYNSNTNKRGLIKHNKHDQ